MASKAVIWAIWCSTAFLPLVLPIRKAQLVGVSYLDRSATSIGIIGDNPGFCRPDSEIKVHG
jgi:hypothetical protein